jgi:hypothetical protein
MGEENERRYRAMKKISFAAQNTNNTVYQNQPMPFCRGSKTHTLLV